MSSCFFSSLEKIFIEHKIYRLIENANSWGSVIDVITNALIPFENELKIKISKDTFNVINPYNNKVVGKGPIAKFFSEKAIIELVKLCKLTEKDSIFFSCDKEKNVVKRVIDTSDYYKAKNIILITGDCPLVDYNLIDQCVKVFEYNDCDFVTNANIHGMHV